MWRPAIAGSPFHGKPGESQSVRRTQESGRRSTGNVEVTSNHSPAGINMPGDGAEGERSERLLALAADAESHLWGSTDAIWMNRLEKEHDGLRAAFSWFLDHGRGADALELAADLWLFQESRGHAEEARTWLAKALAAPGAEPRSITRARALYGAGILAFRNLDDDMAREAFEECRGIAQEQDYIRLVGRATTGFARLALRRGYKRGDRYVAPYELIWLGRVALGRGNPTRAATLFAAAKAQFDATGLAMDPDEGPEYEKGLAAIRGALDDAPFEAARAEGKKMNLDDAVTFARGAPHQDASNRA